MLFERFGGELEVLEARGFLDSAAVADGLAAAQR